MQQPSMDPYAFAPDNSRAPHRPAAERVSKLHAHDKPFTIPLSAPRVGIVSQQQSEAQSDTICVGKCSPVPVVCVIIPSAFCIYTWYTWGRSRSVHAISLIGSCSCNHPLAESQCLLALADNTVAHSQALTSPQRRWATPLRSAQMHL